MHDTPPISAVCVTYGRPQLLEEAIYSFLQQDYPGKKELIVLNDLKEQQLFFDHPEVRVINVPKRFYSLGEKRNAAISMARHDIIFPWDDDDICLPHRLAFSIRHLSENRGYFKPNSYFLWNEDIISGPIAIEENHVLASGCFTKVLFDRVGGYAPIMKWEDKGFMQAVEKLLGRDEAYHMPDKMAAFYLYRWHGTGSYHTGGTAQKTSEPAAEYQRVGDYVSRQIEQGTIPQGNVLLEPKWRDNYADMVADHLRQLKRESV